MDDTATPPDTPAPPSDPADTTGAAPPGQSSMTGLSNPDQGAPTSPPYNPTRVRRLVMADVTGTDAMLTAITVDGDILSTMLPTGPTLADLSDAMQRLFGA